MKKVLIDKGEKLLKVGTEFAEQLTEWVALINGDPDAVKKFEKDPELQELNKKLGELSDRLDEFM